MDNEEERREESLLNSNLPISRALIPLEEEVGQAKKCCQEFLQEFLQICEDLEKAIKEFRESIKQNNSDHSNAHKA